MLGLLKDKLKLGSRDERKDALPLPNGLLALSSSHDGLLRVWDERGRCALTLAGHEKAVYTVVNLPDGRVASGGYDNCIRIWNLRTARCETVIKGHTDSVFCLRVFFVDREAANRAAASTAANINNSASSASPHAGRVIPPFKIISSSSDKTIKVWNGVTYKCEQTLNGHTGSILSLVQLSDTLLASGSLDKTIRVWNLERNRCEVVMSGHLSSVSGLAVLDDNMKIASCSYDETIKLWTLHPPPADAPNDHPMTFTLDKSIRGHTSAIMNLLHLPASLRFPQRLVTCSRDLNIKVWTLPADSSGAIGTLRCISNITSHRNDINNLCVLSDERTLVSCSSDCMIKTFDLEKTGAITTSELSITNTNQDGKGYTVYSVCPLPDSRRTPLRKAMQNAAVREWEEVPHPLDPQKPGVMRKVSQQRPPQYQTFEAEPPAGPSAGLVVGGMMGVGQMANSPQVLNQQHNLPPTASRPISRATSLNTLDQLALHQHQQPQLQYAPPPHQLIHQSGGLVQSSDPIDSDSDIDDDELNAKPLILKADHELDPILRRVIQKYRLRHYLNCGNLMEDGFYDDGGVVFVTTSHVPKTNTNTNIRTTNTNTNPNSMQNNAARPNPQPQLQQPPQQPQQKISLNNRLSFAGSSSSPHSGMAPSANPPPIPPPTMQLPMQLQSNPNPVGTLAQPVSTTFKPYKQWSEETIVLDARFDQNLRSTTEEAKRLLAGEADLKARIMLLALFVSNKLGGSPKDIVREWQTSIATLRKVYGRGMTWAPAGSPAPPPSPGTAQNGNRRLVIPIGSLIGRVGLSRHRALLFKYLCDQTVLFPENWSPPLPPQHQTHTNTSNTQESPRASPPPNSQTPVVNKANESPNSNNTPAQPPAAPDSSVAVDDEKMGLYAPVAHAMVNMTPLQTLSGDEDAPDRINNANSNQDRSESIEPDGPASSPAPSRPIRMQSGEPAYDPVVYPSIHCRLIRGQYEYHFPRSRKTRSRTQRTWEESWEDQEAGYSRHQDAVGSSKTFHAWVVVELEGAHYVVDLSYEPSQLYLESSKEAAHYNRGRLGDVRKTGLTAAPLRSLHEVKWHELTDLVLLRDGGFGRVEKAKYRGLEVVCKTPLNQFDPYILRTFMEEAQVLNLLSHPNIVKLVGVCSEKKAIVLDFVQGGDMHTFIKTHAIAAQQYHAQLQLGLQPKEPFQPLTMLERLDMCIQTALGMQYLHCSEPNFVHRDLKTLNLLVSTVKYHPDDLSPQSTAPHLRRSNIHGDFVQKRVIKVCDFGLARNQHHDDGISTQHKDVGTPAFQCWGAETRVLMYDGDVKTIREVVEEFKCGKQQVMMGPDSLPRFVSGAHTGNTATDVASPGAPQPATYSVQFPSEPHLQSWTCNDRHVLVLRINQPPYVTDIRQPHGGDTYAAMAWQLTTIGDVTTPILTQLTAVPVSCEKSEVECALRHYLLDHPWSTPEWEVSAGEFLTYAPSVQSLCRMFTPEYGVEYSHAVSTGRDLNSRLSSVIRGMGPHHHCDDPIISDQLVLTTAWMMGVWVTMAGRDILDNTSEGHAHATIMQRIELWCAAVAAARHDTMVDAGKAALCVALRDLLSSYGLLVGERHVPADLMVDRREVRMHFLAGVIDGAGDYSHHDRRFTLLDSSSALVSGVACLARSLGFWSDPVAGGQPGVLLGGHHIDAIPVASHHKRAAKRDQSMPTTDDRHQSAGAFTVSQVDHADYYGVHVAGDAFGAACDGRVLLADLLVSHNSPEQWRDDEEERLTTATDVYSFGGIVQEIVTDRMPWYLEKCWGSGTRFLLYDGSSKSIDDIVRDHRAGIKQLLMGDDSTPRTVTAATESNTQNDEDRWTERQKQRPDDIPRPAMYRIQLHDQARDAFTCNGDHILVLQFDVPPTSICETASGAFTFSALVVSGGEDVSSDAESNSWRGGLLNMATLTFSTRSAANAARAQSPSAALLTWECTVDEFLRSATPFIRSQARMFQPPAVHFAQPERSIEQRIKHIRQDDAAVEAPLIHQAAESIARWIVHRTASDPSPLLAQLIESYDLVEPNHFPLELRRESVEIRQSMLRGIMALAVGESELTKSAVACISHPSRLIIDGVVHLCRGVGAQTSPITTLSTGESTISIRIGDSSLLSTGFDVTPMGHAAYFGLSLDRNERCLLSDFIVTHNSKYAIYQHVMVEKRLPPIPADEPLHPKLIELIDACHQFEPAGRPAFPEILRILREVSDELEEAQLQQERITAAATTTNTNRTNQSTRIP